RAGPASARVYLPPGAAGKIPVVVYFHGGGFVVGSPARPGTHNYLNDLVARSGAIGVSVYYRLAPEHKLPAAYDDAWAALRWAATLGGGEDPWLLEHADLSRVFLAGCSAGANIAHNTARAPRRRDHPRARRGAPLLHGQRGRGRRDDAARSACWCAWPRTTSCSRSARCGTTGRSRPAGTLARSSCSSLRASATRSISTCWTRSRASSSRSGSWLSSTNEHHRDDE
ncbi:NAD(P)H dehydrogenase C1, partial [Zea mays]